MGSVAVEANLQEMPFCGLLEEGDTAYRFAHQKCEVY